MTPVCTSVLFSPLQHFARTKTTQGLRNHPMPYFDPNRGNRGPRGALGGERREARGERPELLFEAPQPQGLSSDLSKAYVNVSS